MDFAAEREKRRTEAYQQSLAQQDARKRAEERAREVATALNADINTGRSEDVRVSVNNRTVTVQKGVDALKIDVRDDLSYDLDYKYGKEPGVSRPTIDRKDHAGNNAELGVKVDRWRGLQD